MKKMFPFRKKKNPRRTDSSPPSAENNNNVTQHVNDLAGNRRDDPMPQSTLNSQEEQDLLGADGIKLQGLAELLGVTDDANNSEDGFHGSVQPETNSEEQAERLIRRSVSKHFPKPPADLDRNLQQHLLNVQETMQKQLVKLCPLLVKMGLMARLIDCYHRHIFDHLNDLLLKVHSFHNTSLLMKWVLKTYLSHELLNHPDLQEVEPIKKVDFLLFTEWVSKANNKILKIVQEEIRGVLEKILLCESIQKDCHSEEACIKLFFDTIQCTESMLKEAQNISSELSDRVWEVCFQELSTFLGWYTAEQTKILREKAKMYKPETIHFFKTLNNCRKLKQYVQSKSKGIKGSLLQGNVAMLEKMEAFTLKLLLEIVANIAESHLKKYFKTDKHCFSLIFEVEARFPKLSWCQDVQNIVMEKAYECIAHIYLEHLVRRSHSKLTKCWSPDVGRAVTDDAELLHSTISDLAPGVKQWNLMLLKIQELLGCTNTDSMKLTVASMRNCPTWSQDQELLPTLLYWKGLPGWQVKEVLGAFPGWKRKAQIGLCIVVFLSYMLVKAELPF